METSFFFNARETQPGTFDRVYKAEVFASYFAKFIGNGVFPNPSTGLQVVENDTPDMSVLLSPGSAYINGYGYENDAPKSFSIKVADGTLNRKDAIFIRFDKTGRAIESYKMEGSLGIDPIAPKVVRTTDYFDLCVAIINVNAGITKITQDMIEDTRLDTDVCGIVTGLIEQVDTKTLYEQIQSDLHYFKTMSEAEFTAWFEDIKGMLEGDVATNLQLQINELKSGMDDTMKKSVYDADGDGMVDLSKQSKNTEAINNKTLEMNLSGTTLEILWNDVAPIVTKATLVKSDGTFEDATYIPYSEGGV